MQRAIRAGFVAAIAALAISLAGCAHNHQQQCCMDGAKDGAKAAACCTEGGKCCGKCDQAKACCKCCEAGKCTCCKDGKCGDCCKSGACKKA